MRSPHSSDGSTRRPPESRARFVQRAARGGLLIAFSQVLLAVASYVVAAILARGLGPAFYGIYGVVYSFLLTMELIGRMGIPQATSRMVAQRGSRASRLEATGFTLCFLVSLGLFCVFWLAAPVLASVLNIGENGTWYFRVAALDIPFYGLFFVFSEILTGRRDYVGVTIGYTVYCLAKVIGVVLLWAIGPTVTNALLLNVAASLLGVCFMAYRVGAQSLRFRLAFWRPVLHLAVPIAVAITGTQLLNSVDLWALNAIGVDIADEVKGYYVAATTLARMPTIAAFVFTAVLIPSVSRAVGMGDPALVLDTVKGALRFLLLILVPGCVLIGVQAAPLMALLFSDPYAAGADLLRILIVGQGIFNTLFFALMSTLVAINAQMIGARIAVLAVPFALLCNALLVPPLGAVGAAVAALLPALGASAVALVLVWRRLGPVLEIRTLARIMLVSAIVGGIAQFLPTSGLLVLLELAVLGLAALGLAMLLRVFTLSDIRPLIPAKLSARLGLAS